MSNRIVIWSSQGRRPAQEDRAGYCSLTGSHPVCMWVADGHGGCEVSQMIHEKLPFALMRTNADRISAVNILHSLASEHDSGSTLTFALIGRGQILITHLGDSAAFIISRDGATNRLTSAHLASSSTEALEIVRRGGNIVGKDPPRVNGDLMITRAVGDSYLSCLNRTPELHDYTIRSGDAYLLLVSDGITDTISNEEIGFILMGGGPRMLCEEAIRRGSYDNCTAITYRLS